MNLYDHIWNLYASYSSRKIHNLCEGAGVTFFSHSQPPKKINNALFISYSEAADYRIILSVSSIIGHVVYFVVPKTTISTF